MVVCVGYKIFDLTPLADETRYCENVKGEESGE